MGKILFRLMLLLVSVIGLLMVIGSWLPRDFDLETSIEIDVPDHEVFKMVNSLPNWKHWSTFNDERIEGLKTEYGQTREGIGAVLQWTDARGQGKLWITESTPNELVRYRLQFLNFQEMENAIELKRLGERKTLVLWKSSGSLPEGPFYGYSSFLFATQMEHLYSQSLGRLKQFMEN